MHTLKRCSRCGLWYAHAGCRDCVRTSRLKYLRPKWRGIVHIGHHRTEQFSYQAGESGYPMLLWYWYVNFTPTTYVRSEEVMTKTQESTYKDKARKSYGCTRRQTAQWKELVTVSTEIASNSAMSTTAQKRKESWSLTVLAVFMVNLTQPVVITEKGDSLEEMPPWNPCSQLVIKVRGPSPLWGILWDLEW